MQAVEGMGFAIPSNQVKRIVTEIMETGKVRRALVGVSFIDKAEAKLYMPEVKIDHGVYVVEVLSSGPAAKAGIRKGDIITEFGGRSVNDIGTFVALLSEKSPGDRVKIKVLRNDQTLEFDVVLAELHLKPGNRASEQSWHHLSVSYWPSGFRGLIDLLCPLDPLVLEGPLGHLVRAGPHGQGAERPFRLQSGVCQRHQVT